MCALLYLKHLDTLVAWNPKGHLQDQVSDWLAFCLQSQTAPILSNSPFSSTESSSPCMNHHNNYNVVPPTAHDDAQAYKILTGLASAAQLPT